MSAASRILSAAEAGDKRAADQLLPLVYDELRRLAAARLADERPGQSLDATGLVHEAYLRLTKGDDQPWDGRTHFFLAAAEAMRRILIERARKKGRQRHGGGRVRVSLDEAAPAEDPDDLRLALNDELDRLAELDSQAADVVKLRYFVGLTIEQTAKALGVSVSTANRHWAFARAWLFQRLG